MQQYHPTDWMLYSQISVIWEHVLQAISTFLFILYILVSFFTLVVVHIILLSLNKLDSSVLY